ncbi:unnamed protein product [Heterobilharzia americana]|nr:unnamed protein product [Heterobilharzia americana]
MSTNMYKIQWFIYTYASLGYFQAFLDLNAVLIFIPSTNLISTRWFMCFLSKLRSEKTGCKKLQGYTASYEDFVNLSVHYNGTWYKRKSIQVATLYSSVQRTSGCQKRATRVD